MILTGTAMAPRQLRAGMMVAIVTRQRGLSSIATTPVPPPSQQHTLHLVALPVAVHHPHRAEPGTTWILASPHVPHPTLPLHQSAPYLPAPSWSARLKHKVAVELPERVGKEWTGLAAHPDADGWRRKVHAYGTRLLSRLEWEEWLAVQLSVPHNHTLVPSSSPAAAPHFSVVVHHPTTTAAPDVRAAVAEWAETRRAVHARWRGLTGMALPLSLLCGVLPGPNLPLFYNGFRVWAHHRAVENLDVLLASDPSHWATVELEPLDAVQDQLQELPGDVDAAAVEDALALALIVGGTSAAPPSSLAGASEDGVAEKGALAPIGPVSWASPAQQQVLAAAMARDVLVAWRQISKRASLES
ncbi:mitochondrial K+-H+ exchange-related-domain-containing protein [Blastocladiella britannica]|nr:mitochondrial K+-H+ exchange-related-domain-containing protein [Blastocladiella britannica]